MAASAAPAPASPPSPPPATEPPTDVSPPLLSQPPSDVSLLVLAGMPAPDAAAENPTGSRGCSVARPLDGCDDDGINSNDPAGGTSSKSKKKATQPAVAAVQVRPMPPLFVGNVSVRADLSRVFKSESTELSDDRLAAASSRSCLVRATHGVSAGAWYFEAKVLRFRPNTQIPKEKITIGWATSVPEEVDDAPVDGFEVKMDQELREKEKHGDEGDAVFGFYIFLPDGERSYEPDQVVPNRDQQDTPAQGPGSEIRYFKNGVFQGIPFKDIAGGMYYPAAVMYTSPTEPDYIVKLNFGPYQTSSSSHKILVDSQSLYQ